MRSELSIREQRIEIRPGCEAIFCLMAIYTCPPLDAECHREP